jgi:hypothetical protein
VDYENQAGWSKRSKQQLMYWFKPSTKNELFKLST